MDPTNIRDLLHALKIEMLRYRWGIVFLFIAVSAAVLTAGYLLPKTYTSRVVLYADDTNIIGNLLEGKAEITKIDRAKEARDIIFTDRILREVAKKSGFEDPERNIARIRGKMSITSNGDYLYVRYSSSSKDESYNVLFAVTEEFLKETVSKKREESRDAYEFIDSQVISYKNQLTLAETALKEFSAQNIDITEQSVAGRVTKYKTDIQVLELEIEDSQSRLASFNEELNRESEFLNIETERAPTFEERQLEDYERQLSDLRLSYLDTHPDIISLLDQIEALRAVIALQREEEESSKSFTQVENPAYTQLKEVINEERANLKAQMNRLSNTRRLLAVELANAETVAEKQATYKELTRDYAVTKGVYEDMLKTRESARLSMTLDIEGQGVSYKIHEGASYPINFDGLQLIHYALIGPVLGLVVPLGLIGVMILLDSKVRSVGYMSENLPSHIHVITSIPMYNSAVLELASKRSLVILCCILTLYLLVYGAFSIGAPVLSILGIAGNLAV